MTGLKKYPAGLVACLLFVCMAATPIKNWHYSGNNIALHKSASQLPETYFDNDGIHKHYPASLAVDGNTDGYFKHGHCSHTIGKSYVDASWTVNLGKPYRITGIIIYNRGDVKIRLKNFKVIGDDHTLIHDSEGTEEYNQAKITIELDGLRTFSRITVLLPSGNGYSDGGNYYLTLCEVQIYAAPRPACDIIGTYITNGQTNIYHNSGRAIDGRYTVGTIVEVTCLDNFHPSGPSRLTCLPSEKYDYPIPKCEEVCAPILTPSNGYLVPDQLLYLVNASLKLVCDEGYETETANIIQCQSGGRWETPIPTCHRVQCVLPNNPKHGYYSVDGHTAFRETSSSKLPYMTEITGLCDAGYKNIYPKKRICKSDKTWSDHEAICTAVECSYHGNKTNLKDCIPKMCNWPLLIKNGFYTASNDPTHYGMQYNTLLTATCNNGYKLSDNYKDRRCNEDAVWENTPAVCYPMCVIPVVINGKFINALSTNFVVGTTLHFTCNPGFTAEALGNTITCQKNHTWTAMPVCQDQTCVLPVVTNGKFINALSTHFVVGTILRFTCNPGFTAETLGDTITCQKNHSWTPMPVCQDQTCVLPDVTNGKFINALSTHFVVGTTLRFFCNPGFTAEPLEDTITCQDNRNWTALPVCREIMCVLPVVTNGKFINALSTKFVVGTTLRFTCNPGFTAEPLGETITCQKNNKWTTEPVCQDQMCVLPVLTNGQFINALTTNFVVGTTLRFTCNPGFTAEALVNTITCQNNHTWTPMPVCQDQMCEFPDVTNGKFINALSTNFVVGTTLRFTCNPGFTAESLGDTITCQKNHKWTATPDCQEKPEASNSAVTSIVVAVTVVSTLAIIAAVVIFIFKRLRNTPQEEERDDIVNGSDSSC